MYVDENAYNCNILFILTYMNVRELLSEYKSFFVLCAVLVLTFAIGMLPSKWFGINPVQKQYQRLDLSGLTAVEDQAQDTNNDGSISWDEVIRQTYKGNLDEVKNIPVDEKAVKMLNDPNNLTGSLSKNMYIAETYIQNGEGVTDDQKKEIVAKLLLQEARKVTVKVYTVSDISVSKKAETKESIKAYGNAVGTLVTLALKNNLAFDDIDYINTYIKRKDTDSLLALQKKAEVTDEILTSLLEMSIPPSALVYHLNVVNKLSAYKGLLDNVSVLDTDPVRGSIAFNQYEEVNKNLMSAIVLLTRYFSLQDISFTAKDSGFVFSPMYTIK